MGRMLVIPSRASRFPMWCWKRPLAGLPIIATNGRRQPGNFLVRRRPAYSARRHCGRSSGHHRALDDPAGMQGGAQVLRPVRGEFSFRHGRMNLAAYSRSHRDAKTCSIRINQFLKIVHLCVGKVPARFLGDSVIGEKSQRPMSAPNQARYSRPGCGVVRG